MGASVRVFVLLAASFSLSCAAQSAGKHTGFSDLEERPTLTLEDVLARIRKQHPQAEFLHAEYGVEDGRPDCAVALWSAQGLLAIELDARTGEVIRSETPVLDDESSELLRKRALRYRNCVDPVSVLPTALATLPGSWARLIEFDSASEPPAYQLEIVAGEIVKEVRIDATNGSLLWAGSYEELRKREEETDSDR